MKILRTTSFIAMILVLVACNKPEDLDAPCPDYGRHCPQTPINADLF